MMILILILPETVVVELVVAGHGDDSAPRRTQGVEHL